MRIAVSLLSPVAQLLSTMGYGYVVVLADVRNTTCTFSSHTPVSLRRIDGSARPQ